MASFGATWFADNRKVSRQASYNLETVMYASAWGIAHT